MAYNELIKNFERIRSYMREFYVYGFKSRDEYNVKSGRSYDDERRRIESWLGDYMFFRRSSEGKIVFLSIDSRTAEHNPLYTAWKSKSFTDGDITLHFILMDILHSPEIRLSLSEIIKLADNDYLSCFENPIGFDESTIRKKLSEYIKEGIIVSEKNGKKLLYRRADMTFPDFGRDALDFYSETAPCGVIGSFLIDKRPPQNSNFRYKHHYITHVLDSAVLYRIFRAMREKRTLNIENLNRHADTATELRIVPLCVYISAQNGRQHLLAYNPLLRRFQAYRIDYITKAESGDICESFDELRKKLSQMRSHMWGVSCGREYNKTEHVEFTVHIEDYEEFIFQRMMREKRCGTVERIDKNTVRFSADVYDTAELIPWIRTFICRITKLNFSDRTIENQFKADIEEMFRLYEIDGGNGQ